MDSGAAAAAIFVLPAALVAALGSWSHAPNNSSSGPSRGLDDAAAFAAVDASWAAALRALDNSSLVADFVSVSSQPTSALSPIVADILIGSPDALLPEGFDVNMFVDEEGLLKIENLTPELLAAGHPLQTQWQHGHTGKRVEDAAVNNKLGASTGVPNKDAAAELAARQEAELFACCSPAARAIAHTVCERLGSSCGANFAVFSSTLASELATLPESDKVLELLWTSVFERSDKAAVLHTSAVFELAVNNALYSLLRPDKSRPEHTKLTEVLSDPDLATALRHSDGLIFFARLLVGPKYGLNLRNVFWHGFVGDREMPLNYGPLLLSLLVSFDRAVTATTRMITAPSAAVDAAGAVSDDQVPAPPQEEPSGTAAFNRLPPVLGPLPPFVDWEEPPSAVTALLSSSRGTHAIRRTLATSFFCVPGRASTWFEALDALVARDYYTSLTLALPEVEHCIRRLYVVANNSAATLFTAEHENLYTTVDILLRPVLMRTTDEPNFLFSLLHPTLSNALVDVFVWTERGRIRDQLSHFNCSSDSAALRNASLHLWSLFLALAAAFNVSNRAVNNLLRSQRLLRGNEDHTTSARANASTDAASTDHPSKRAARSYSSLRARSPPTLGASGANRLEADDSTVSSDWYDTALAHVPNTESDTLSSSALATLPVPVKKLVLSWATDYVPRGHPLTDLWRATATAHRSSVKLQDLLARTELAVPDVVAPLTDDCQNDCILAKDRLVTLSLQFQSLERLLEHEFMWLVATSSRDQHTDENGTPPLFRANLLDREIRRAGTLLTVVENCREFCEGVEVKYGELHELVESRKAWKRHRKSYANLRALLPLFIDGINLFLAAVEFDFLTLVPDSEIASLAFNAITAIAAILPNNKFRQIGSIFRSFAVPHPEGTCLPDWNARSTARAFCPIVEEVQTYLLTHSH